MFTIAKDRAEGQALPGCEIELSAPDDRTSRRHGHTTYIRPKIACISPRMDTTNGKILRPGRVKPVVGDKYSPFQFTRGKLNVPAREGPGIARSLNGQDVACRRVWYSTVKECAEESGILNVLFGVHRSSRQRRNLVHVIISVSYRVRISDDASERPAGS